MAPLLRQLSRAPSIVMEEKCRHQRRNQQEALTAKIFIAGCLRSDRRWCKLMA